MRTARSLSRYSPLVNARECPDVEAEDAKLAAAVREAYLLADELERVLPSSHRGMAHRLRLAAEATGGLHVASQTRRVVSQPLHPSPE